MDLQTSLISCVRKNSTIIRFGDDIISALHCVRFRVPTISLDLCSTSSSGKGGVLDYLSGGSQPDQKMAIVTKDSWTIALAHARLISMDTEERIKNSGDRILKRARKKRSERSKRQAVGPLAISGEWPFESPG